MGLKVTQMLVPSSKYGIKCPYAMTPQYITIHNTANDASALSEISYMINNNYEVSYHYAVDDVQAVQGIPVNRNAWHAGDGLGMGNTKSIGIEICYSLSGGSRFTKAEDNAAYLTAALLKERGWGIDRVRRHYDWSGKYCPHRTMDMGWERWLNLVRKYLGVAQVSTPTPSTPSNNTSKPSNNTGGGKAPQIIYGVKTKNHGTLQDVNGRSDYAGYANDAIVGIKIGVTSGSVKYRVHCVNVGWYEPVTGSNWNDGNNGWAGDGVNSIDAIQIYYSTDVSKAGRYYTAVYQVKPFNQGMYLGNVYDTNFESSDGNNTAGIFGVPFTQLLISLE